MCFCNTVVCVFSPRLCVNGKYSVLQPQHLTARTRNIKFTALQLPGCGTAAPDLPGARAPTHSLQSEAAAAAPYVPAGSHHRLCRVQRRCGSSAMHVMYCTAAAVPRHARRGAAGRAARAARQRPHKAPPVGAGAYRGRPHAIPKESGVPSVTLGAPARAVQPGMSGGRRKASRLLWRASRGAPRSPPAPFQAVHLG